MRRALALSVAPVALLLPAAPALGQESPAPEACPNVSYAPTQEQQSAPAGQPVTYTFGSDVQPARTPDGWTLTRLSPGPEQLVDSRPAGPTATFTVTVSETTTYRVQALGPDGCGPASATFTRTVPSPGAAQRCPGISRVVVPQDVVAGQAVGIEVQLTSAASSNRVTLVRLDPAPVAEVRSSAADLTASFTVRLGESHRFRVRVTRDDGVACAGGPGQEAELLVPVRAAVSLAAVRNAPRDYTFSGRVLPGYGTVALYRVEQSGRRVLTAEAAVVGGTWRVDRRFLGAGRFGFVAVASPGSTGRYSGGESRVRPTVVH